MNKVLKNIVNLIKQQKKYKKYKISEATRKAFLGEQWVDATTALIELNNKYKKFDLLSGLFDIKVAKSRLTGLKNDKKILVKELEQSMILADLGYSIYLLPKKKDINGNFVKAPDAIVNDLLYEFKTITGPIRKIERHFRKSRDQSINVFLRIMRPEISKNEVLLKIRQILIHPTYKGGTGGNLIFHLEGTKETYFFRIIDLMDLIIDLNNRFK